VIARDLNETCFCLPVAGTPLLASTHPLFLDRAVREQLLDGIAAVGRALDTLAPRTPAIDAAALFNSFDFHLTADGPRLIEINVNAGGAFLQGLIRPGLLPAGAQALCNGQPEPEFDPVMTILDAWRAAKGETPLNSVAIVDIDPAGQGLYGDMLLARDQLHQLGIACQILDIGDLRLEAGRLTGPDGAIDMVYNRCTDFTLSNPGSASLRAAWQSGAALVAPNPDTHAAFADKSLLIGLSELALNDRDALACILETRALDAGNADELWRRRREFVFKPRQGYGSRGVYRGDKLSARRWPELVAGRYLAQAYAEPLPRTLPTSTGPRRFKSDIRVWTHGVRPLHMAARLYSGQVMGMKREAEGFAPIVWVTDGLDTGGLHDPS
jgi:hypothetical protein